MGEEFEFIERLLGGPLPLSPLPPLAFGVEVLAARWISERHAAILWLSRPDPDDADEELDEPLTQYIQTFSRTSLGWVSGGAGGSGWPWEYGERPSAGGLRLSGSASQTDDVVYVTSGVAGPDVAALQVVGRSASVVEVNPVGSFFVLGGDVGDQVAGTPIGARGDVVGSTRRTTLDPGAEYLNTGPGGYGRVRLRRRDPDGWDDVPYETVT